MSYLEFYCANIDKSNCESIQGTCYQLCPQDEVVMRERENLVHVLEVWGPLVRKLVKCYCRSAADSTMTVPRLLRPYSVLKDTVEYLLFEVSKRTDVSPAMLYDFLNDRLRAVRQDITIQRLPPEECIKLLEPMIRFHVYYGYKLCELPLKDYDPVLNKKYLLECLKWFLFCCDTITQTRNNQDLSYLLSHLDIDKNLCDRVLMESLYVLSNLDDVHPLFRYLNLPKSLKSEPTLQLAYRIALANLKGNYVAVCKLLDRLCPLGYCAMCVHLPTLQRRALQAMSCAYNSKQLAVPVGALRRWLRYSSDSEAAAACEHYGVAVRGGGGGGGGGGARFARAEFKTDAPTLPPQKLQYHEKKLDMSIDNIFTYTTRNNGVDSCKHE